MDLVVQNIQPSTVSVDKEISRLMFNCLRTTNKEDIKEEHAKDLHPPYKYQITDHSLYSRVASSHKDYYSVGIIILEILVGTDIVIPATTEVHLEKMYQDCCAYLDSNTQGLLSYLIFDENVININTYIEIVEENDGEIITTQILKIEAALEEDGDLQRWTKTFDEIMIKDPTKMND
jgi:hypothetical protein